MQHLISTALGWCEGLWVNSTFYLIDGELSYSSYSDSGK